MDVKKEINIFIDNQKINYLVHFTAVDNLQSILRHGLLSRKILCERNIPYFHTDTERIDGHLDAISVSVSFPNYKMFFKKREYFKEKTWIVIFISTDILTNSDCFFIDGNAAEYKNKKNKVINSQ